MKSYFNPFRRMAEADAPAGDAVFAAEGLASRLDAYLEANPTQGGPDTPETPPVVVPPDAPPAKPADTPGEEEEEEKFPELGTLTTQPALTTPAFDEAAFDAATEEEVKGWAPAAGTKFKEIKAKLKETTKELLAAKSAPPVVPAEVTQELESLRPLKSEVEGLRQRNQELLRANDAVAVRESPEFEAKVSKPIRDLDDILAVIAEGSGVDINHLAAVITETNPAKQDQMLDQLEPKLGRGLRRLERLTDDYKAIKQAEKELLADAPKTIERTRQQRLDAEKAEAEVARGHFRAATTEAFTTYAKRVPGFTDSAGGLTPTAQAILDKTAAIDPKTFAPGDLAYMSFCANSFPAARAAIVRLEKENALLRAGKPVPAPLAGKPPAAAAPKADDDGPPKGLLASMEGKEFTFTGV